MQANLAKLNLQYRVQVVMKYQPCNLCNHPKPFLITWCYIAHAQCNTTQVEWCLISMEGWKRQAEIKSLSIACLSIKKIIIDSNYLFSYRRLREMPEQISVSSSENKPGKMVQ